MENKHEKNSLAFNKAFIINHFEEFVNKKNSAVAFENLDPGFLDHDEAGGPAIGPDAAIKMMDGLHGLLPDIHVSIEDILAEDDRVMVRNIWTGTNLKGETVQFKGFVLWRLKDGKIVERWATVTPPKPVESETPIW
jgi:predicted ester cyclase